MSSELTITVAGTINTGKTTVARIIEEALLQYGFKSVVVQDLDPSSNKEAIHTRIEKTKNRKVTIKVKQLPRETYDGDDTRP